MVGTINNLYDLLHGRRIMSKTLNKKQKQILNRYAGVQSVYQLPDHVMTDLIDIGWFENIEADAERYLNDNFLYYKKQGL